MSTAVADPPAAPPVPPHEDPEQAAPVPADLALELDGQLSFAVGGKKVTTGSVRLVGGKVDVDGNFEKGQRIVLRVEAVITEVAFRDKKDPKTGNVTGCDRAHKATVTGLALEE